MQLIEGLYPFVTGDGGQSPGIQLVGEQHGRRFAEPREPGLALGVLERDDENPGDG